MNRAERRRQQRQLERKTKDELSFMKKLCGRNEKTDAVDWALKLSIKEQEYLNFMMTENSKHDIQVYVDAYTIALRINLDDNEELINQINRDIEKEGYKVKEYRDNGGDYIMALKNNKEQIIKDYEKGIKENIKESELIKDLAVNYKATQNSIKLIIRDYKKELKAQEEEKEIEEAAAYILEEPVVAKNETTENKKVEKQEKTDKNTKSKFKVISKEITIEGQHGVHSIKNGTLRIEDVVYTREEDVKQDYSDTVQDIELEYKETIKKAEELRKERMDSATSSKNEALEIMEEFM